MASKHPRKNHPHRKEQRRKDAEERNAAYQKLSFEEKLARNSTKVRAKLEAKKKKLNKIIDGKKK